jgi:hypothetical protein
MVNRAKREQPAHPLVGVFFHTLTDDGAINYQARVLGVDGDVVIAQMFSWLTGDPTNFQTFDKAFMYSDRCKLYATQEAWNHAAEMESRRSSGRRASV